MADATITIGASATPVEAAMAVGLAAVKNFATEAQSAVGSAVRSIATSLADVALQHGKVNFSSQQQQVRDFEASTARMAVSAGRDLESVRSEAEATGIAIGKRPGEVVAWSSEVGKLTYNFSGALAGMKGMAELSAMTGRNVQEYRGLAVELQTVGHVAGDTSKMVGLLKAQADTLGVSGGVAAFADEVEALKDAFSHFDIKDNFGDITALTGKLAQGLNPYAAQRVQQSVFGTLASNPFEWSRYLGRDIFNEKGQLEDPNKTVADIVSKIEHTYGKGGGRRALMLQFGVEAGSQLHNLYQSGELFRTPNVSPPGGGNAPTSPQDALAKLLGSDAGKRDVAEAKLFEASDKLLNSSSFLGRAADALQQFAAGHPIASTAAATAAGGVVAGGVTSVGTTLATKVVQGTAKTTVGRMAAGALGTVAPAVGAFGLGLYGGWELAGGQEEVDRIAASARLDPEKAHELVVAKEARDRVRAARGMKALTGGYAPSAEDTALARNSGTAQGMTALIGKLKGEGVSEKDAQTIGKIIADAMKQQLQGMQVQVAQDPNNPVTATLSTSQSSAAGNQSGT